MSLALGEDLRCSARNQFAGQIARLERGSVNADVSIDLGNSKTLSAIITNRSSDQLELCESLPVTAFFKASSVILIRV